MVATGREETFWFARYTVDIISRGNLQEFQDCIALNDKLPENVDRVR